MNGNPFSVSYITEGNYTADGLLARYSFLPFLHLQRQIGRPINVFLIGRRGVGKTMLLKLYDSELMQKVYESGLEEHKDVREYLPAATVGVYLNLAAPDSKLNLFQGHSLDRETWLRSYSDYLNCLLLRGALGAMDRMMKVRAWRARFGVNDDWDQNSLVADLAEELSNESSAFEGVRSRPQLDALLSSRIRLWSRYLNNDPSVRGVPQTPLALGVPLFALLNVLRRSQYCGEACRVFVLLDQYEALYHHRRVIDFRPIFNQAMYEASRGGTGVEFKIGTRRYSHDNLRLLSGDGRIEDSREILELDLDLLAGKFYRKFVVDLFSKRVAATAEGKSKQEVTRLAKRLLPRLSAKEEAELYMGAEKGARRDGKHLKQFASRWANLGLMKPDEVFQRSGLADAHPLVATLVCIALTRWFRSGAEGVPIGCQHPEGAKLGLDLVVHFAAQLLSLIDGRYLRVDAENADSASGSTPRAIDNFVRDAEQVALFVIASSYKNQRKYYCGLDSLIRLSSNVALVFIEIVGACYELLLFDGGDAGLDAVQPHLQSEAVYRVSERWFNQVPSQCDYGQTIQEFLRGLGANFHELQLEISAPDPSPNGFSVSPDGIGDPEQMGEDPRRDARRLLREAVSWGFLEERVHQDKTRGRAKRTKYYINRILCPYFGLSDIQKKDPMYVRNVQRFVESALRGGEIEDVRLRLTRSVGTQSLTIDAQAGLF